LTEIATDGKNSSMLKPRKGPTDPWRERIVAHRGASREAPENTRSAFDAALRSGIYGMEFDVQLSADGVAVIYHDRTLSRVGGGRRRIADCSLRELRSLDFGAWFDPSFAGEPLMTLDAVLRRYHRRSALFIEIKSRPRDRLSGRHLTLTKKVLASVARLVPPGLRDSVHILSFDRQVLETAAHHAPQLKYVFNVDSPRSFAPSLRPRGVPLKGCCLPVAKLTPRFSGTLRRQGLETMTYSCNVPRQAIKALREGADLLFSDDPRWLLDYLSRRTETDAAQI
jgi:glycerophosphoryl diester phosphodiesterase